MFTGTARKRDNCRLYTLASVARIALRGDDPDFIVLEALNLSFSGTRVTLPITAPAGKAFTFVLVMNPQTSPNLGTESVVIEFTGSRKGGATLVWTLRAGQEARFIYTPNFGWLSPRGALIGSDDLLSANSIAFGDGASAASGGIAVGTSALANAAGVAIGYACDGRSNGIAIGNTAIGSNNGVAIGSFSNSNSKDVSVALGRYSKAERYRELVKSADGLATCLRSFSILDWYGDTANATPVELLLGGTAAQYAVLLNSSAFMFRLAAIARNNADDVSACWSLTGGIKRGANAAATALIGTVTKTIIGADAGAATWDIDSTADTTNGSLKVTVTGEASKTLRWNVRGDISELRF